MLRSTIHLPPIEEGEFLLCYVKNKKIGQEIEYKYEISLADIFRKYNRNMFCRMKKEL